MSTPTPRFEIDGLLADPLAASRGGIGFVGPDVSVDVLLASGRPFGHLPWRATGAIGATGATGAAGATPWADRWLESSFPFWARSILEQWHDGAFDALDTVIFSRADDASQRLYYYVAELKRRGKLGGPAVHVFDIALVPRATSLEHTERAVADLMRILGVDARALAQGIERANLLRRTSIALDGARLSDGPFYERLFRAALWSDATQWLGGVAMPAPQDSHRPRVLLAGSMPPDERLHVAVDEAGATVVAEAHALAARRLGDEIAAGDERLPRVVAERLRQASAAPRAFFDRAAAVLARARDARADGVILWLTREDEALAWSLPGVHRALDAAGIATLAVPAARWQADDGALERIAEFCGRLSHAAA